MKLIETFHHLVLVWIQNAFAFVNGLRFVCGFRALFMGSASIDFNKFFFKTESHDIMTVWLALKHAFSHVHVFFFFFFLCVNSNLILVNCSCTVHVLKNIKNGSHDTIYTFKNYFATVFSVFSFQQ